MQGKTDASRRGIGRSHYRLYCITEHEGCIGQDGYNQIQDRMAGQGGCGTRRIRDKTYTGQGGQGGFWTIDGCKQMQERSDVGQNG